MSIWVGGVAIKEYHQFHFNLLLDVIRLIHLQAFSLPYCTLIIVKYMYVCCDFLNQAGGSASSLDPSLSYMFRNKEVPDNVNWI